MKMRTKEDYRKRRHFRIRRKISGTAECPRMAVYVSNRYIYVQLIDDVVGKTLCSVSSMGLGNGVETAKDLGKKAADAAKGAGISKVVFDRSGFTFGSRLKALADAAREGGLEF